MDLFFLMHIIILYKSCLSSYEILLKLDIQIINQKLDHEDLLNELYTFFLPNFEKKKVQSFQLNAI